MEEIPGVVDAFCGTRTVLHMGGKEKPDAAAFRKVLKGLKVKVKGDLVLDKASLF